MHISRLRVRNFRNFIDLLIEPFPKSAVIVGVNDIGKTNLLYALRLVLDPDLPDSSRRLRSEDFSDYDTVGMAGGSEIRVEVDLTDLDHDKLLQVACDGCYISLDPLTARITYKFSPVVDPRSQENLTAANYDWSIVGGSDEVKDARRLRRTASLSLLPALRDAADLLSRWRGSPLQEMFDHSPPSRAVLTAAAAKIDEGMNLLAADDNVSVVTKQIRTRLTDLAGPQLDMTPTFGVSPTQPDRLVRSMKLFVDEIRSRTVVDTSTGNANAVYLALLLEKLAVRREARLTGDGILAVEEPEAHIHPVLQRQIFRYLTRTDAPVVVTTHSPHIAAVSPLDSLVLIRGSDDGPSIAASANNAGLVEAEKRDLERYLTVNRAEVLFCRFAILVEGPSEQYVVPALARALGFDLDAHGIVVSSIDGTDFAPYRKLLGRDGLGVPTAIITDGDPIWNGKYALAGLKRASQLSSDRHALLAKHAKLVAAAATDVAHMRAELAVQGLFVGLDTLELDLLGLLRHQFVAAHAELQESSVLRSQFDRAVDALVENRNEPDSITELMRRIKDVSKGRFSQRLSTHIEASSEDLKKKLSQEVADADIWAPPSKVEIKPSDWLRLGGHGYLLGALDYASRTVRNRGLVSVPAAKADQ